MIDTRALDQAVRRFPKLLAVMRLFSKGDNRAWIRAYYFDFDAIRAEYRHILKRERR